MNHKILLSLMLLSGLFVIPDAYSNDGVEKSRLVNDLRSRVNKAKREHKKLKIDISDAERTCINASSTVSDCSEKVSKADEQLKEKIKKLAALQPENQPVVVVVGDGEEKRILIPEDPLNPPENPNNNIENKPTVKPGPFAK